MGPPARFALLVIFMCVVVIGGSAFFEAARPAGPAGATTTGTSPMAATPSAPSGGGSFVVNLLLPLLPWLLVFTFLWVFVFRRLPSRKPPSFLFDSNADAERARRRPWWPRVVGIGFVVLMLFALMAAILSHDSAPRDHLVENALPLAPWIVIFLLIWVFMFRLLRRQTQQNWDGQPNLHLESRMDISPEGVTVMSPVSSSIYRWEAFQRVQETPNLFILFLSTLTFVLVPKRALPDAEAIDSLRGMLRTMIAERPAPAFAVVVPQQPSSQQPPPLPQ